MVGSCSCREIVIFSLLYFVAFNRQERENVHVVYDMLDFTGSTYWFNADPDIIIC